MKKHTLYQIDSFTKEKFTGNPAGVVTNAEGLDEATMQKIARELNNSETAFVFPSQSKDYDVHVRFFTPTKEVPICGHATIAAYYACAVEGNFDTKTIKQKTGAGILAVDIQKEKGDYSIVMTQGKIEFGEAFSKENKDALLAALHINEVELREDCPIKVASTGHSKVMVGIKDKALLNRLSPDMTALSELSDMIGCNGYYVFILNETGSDVLVEGRMFAPAIGINEDPVTGNANGPLGAYLVHQKIVTHDVSRLCYKAKQGEAIGRTGILQIDVEIENNEPIEVKVSGNAVIVFKTELTL